MSGQIKKETFRWRKIFQATVIGIFFITIFQYRSACLDALRQDKFNKRKAVGRLQAHGFFRGRGENFTAFFGLKGGEYHDNFG